MYRGRQPTNPFSYFNAEINIHQRIIRLIINEIGQEKSSSFISIEISVSHVREREKSAEAITKLKQTEV